MTAHLGPTYDAARRARAYLKLIEARRVLTEIDGVDMLDIIVPLDKLIAKLRTQQ